MESLFRSEDVNLCQIIIPHEIAYDVTLAIGEVSCVEFINQNDDVPPSKNILWCEEVERKIRCIKELAQRESLKFVDVDPDYVMLPRPREFNDFEERITSFLDQLTASNTSLSDLSDGLNDLGLYLHVLRCCDQSLLEKRNNESSDFSKNVKVIAGVINRTQVEKFERFIWRSCRGNVVFQAFNDDKVVVDYKTNKKSNMAVFNICLQGTQMIDRIKKICDAHQARLYTIPASLEEKESTIIGLLTRIKNIEIIFNQSAEQRNELMNQICRNLKFWQIAVCKIKAVFVTLNTFQVDHGTTTVLAECWCPKVSIPTVRSVLETVRVNTSSSHSAIMTVIGTKMTVPTYYRTNKFTEGFQALVDSYGVSTYKEINPGLFMVVTFPFLFAVMFGDFGHALIMLFIGIYMVYKERELSKYKSHERLESGTTAGTTNDSHRIITVDVNTNFDGTAYPIGLDPIWMFAKNKLNLINSVKMKLSIIIGFFHMLFGMILGSMNHQFFNRPLDFYGEFIPQFIFFGFLFGYLVFLIFYKWLFISISTKAPSILITFINMFMKFGNVDEDDRFFQGQEYIQSIIVVLSLICVPWMLLVKPFVLFREHRRRRALRVFENNQAVNPLEGERRLTSESSPDHGHSESNMAEIAIMQLIHTIEFCLGGISNTASYLRLWALSLAHSQLSELLWVMVLSPAIRIKWRIVGPVILVVVFYIFLVFTFIILILMEGLSTFLHAIRLHWVEFQSKFYHGQGKPLIVFSLKEIAENNLLNE
ncbi:V-type proton ATPase subunit a isoform 1 [Thelohanellus kitauei]|uniref:V-type proton ATPase subunit a n=1 Tax=Thelohanellus kitauei TaxID=669202 RepID=A0A0C2LZU6_THEKT|nr:V-type proton ATPase subunit a isoform 1 [Thelohanellus kitauei]